MSLIILFQIACRSDESIKSYNVNPEVTLTSHTDGSEVSEGYQETFRAQVSDPNHATSELRTSWFYDDQEMCL